MKKGIIKIILFSLSVSFFGCTSYKQTHSLQSINSNLSKENYSESNRFTVEFEQGSAYKNAVLKTTIDSSQRLPGVDSVERVSAKSIRQIRHDTVRKELPYIINLDISLEKNMQDWLGTPYRYGGCSKSGVDCSCLVQHIYRDVYNVELDRSSLEMANNVTLCEKEHLKRGDLVFFKTRKKRVSHVGIYLGDNKFFHSSRRAGVTISSLDEPYYKKRFFTGGKVEK